MYKVKIPKDIARLKISPNNKALIVWLLINGFNPRSGIIFNAEFDVFTNDLAILAEIDDSGYLNVWDLSSFYRNKQVDRYLRNKYMDPKYDQARYIRYRPG